MKRTGKKLNIKRLVLLAAGLVVLGGTSLPARALDLFTLWSQPEIPLDLTPGSWVDYRSQVMAGGRQETDLTRVACLAAPTGSPTGALVFEIMPLVEEDDGSLNPQPGQGVWLLVSADVAQREGELLDSVLQIWQWEGGVARELSLAELRQDPLVAANMRDKFIPDQVEEKDPTTRIISGRQFLCEQLVMSARDTQSIDLPAGKMTQVSVHEVTAAFSSQLPLLGLAYATERISSESKFSDPHPRVRVPPARVRVEVMEMVANGRDATSQLGPGR